MASIKDVAEMAHVGIGTVSRVLSGNGYVSAETRKTVQAAIEALDYSPNETARCLSRCRTGIVGLVIPDISHPFFSLAAKHIEIELYNAGYKTLICNTIRKSNREKEFLEMLRCRVMDGIIMGSHTLDLTEYRKIKEPIVAFDRIVSADIPCVAADHKKGGKLAAEKLLSNGCRSVLQFTGTHKVRTPSADRHTVFADVMEKSGCRVETVELPWNEFDFTETARIAARIMEARSDIDGIFSSDLVSIACINVLHERHKRVPQDVKVIGYDGTLLADAFLPRLTTIVQPLPLIAEKLVSVMLNRIQNRTQPIAPENMLTLADVYLREGNTTLP
ncbi:LacI family DNA-binding transcriptional regulator [Treponema brennaborense]|uniref:Transcriptional regulator, LacI family n=1 Tax=Treponema brennaborense (strain DSM 12168 / CIP 105900 / DD5/3) TaxID=906968 RepID=F4LP05_TREBD|nr:LacI family DNA-binding transcriptional regulator [Treponema brennaborense]AEE17982.1 transcriptional regulator, LacI family [Treponema brennaborense DSM 12168]